MCCERQRSHSVEQEDPEYNIVMPNSYENGKHSFSKVIMKIQGLCFCIGHPVVGKTRLQDENIFFRGLIALGIPLGSPIQSGVCARRSPTSALPGCSERQCAPTKG